MRSFKTTRMVLLTGCVAFALNAAAAPTRFSATVINSDNKEIKTGAYSFTSDSYGFDLLANSGNLYATGGAFYLGNNQYFSLNVEDWSDYGLGTFYSGYAFDTTTWEQLVAYNAEDNAESSAAAYDAATGKVYGCFHPTIDSPTWYFGTFDDDNFASVRIADVETPWLACDFAADGNLYALDREGVLSTVDKTTGAMTMIASTDIRATELGSGAIDRVTGKFYVANRQNLYCIDLASCSVKVMYELTDNEQIIGMYVTENGTVDAAPAPVSGLTATLGADNSTCTVSFTMPTTDSSGAALEGELTYTVSVDGAAVVENSAAAGATVTETVKISGNGDHTVSVTVSDGNVTGEAVSATVTVSGRPAGVGETPYSQTFDNQEAFNTMTSINRNGDDYHWIYWNQQAYSQFSFSGDANDLLLTPRLWFEAGKNYTFECDVKQRDVNDIEEIAIVMGASPEEADLRTLEAFTLSDGQTHRISVSFNPETTGAYQIGLRYNSPASRYGVFADNMYVSVGTNASAPAAQQIAVASDATGALKATVTVTPVFKTLGGADTDIEKIELYRGQTLIATFTDVTPGQALTFTDELPAAGVYSWEAAPFNASGRGASAMASTYVGINVPAGVKDFKAVETETAGTVSLSWTAPDTDVDGNPFNSSLARYMLAYRLSNGGLRIIADDVTGNSYTAAVRQPDDEQEFLEFIVFSKSDAGTNDADIAVSPKLGIGKPYTIPFAEKFGGSIAKFYTQSYNSASVWRVYDTAAPDQDGNKAFLYFDCYRNHSGSVTTGKVTVSGSNPGFRFWYMGFADATDVIRVSVSTDGNEFIPVSQVCLNEGEDNSWSSYSVSLSDYVGKDVYVRLYFTSTGSRLGIDNMTFENFGSNDIAATAISVPNVGTPGIDTPIRVQIKNNGIERSGEFMIDLYRDGELLTSRIVSDVQPLAYQWFNFYDVLHVFQDKVSYKAVVVAEDDTDSSNNETATATLELTPAPHPAPTALKGTIENGQARLEWESPAIDLEPVTVTDGVDNYTTFSTGLPNSEVSGDNIGHWTTMDGDGYICAIIQQGSEYAQYPNANSKIGFIVMDITKTGLSEKYHYKFLGRTSAPCFMALTSSVINNDDWLVSPVLSGNAQTVKFWAKSAIDTYGLESFDFLVSTTGTKMADFKPMASVTAVPTDWTEYSYDLPEGAKHFAIRYNAYDRYAFLVDDITYEGASDDSYLKQNGLRIYRNREPLATVAEGTDYTDPSFSNGDEYHVTALYTTGESAPSNEARPGYSAIDGIDAESGVTVTVAGRTIIVDNATGLETSVYDSLGRCIATSAATQLSVDVTAGIYLVRSAEGTVKVAVR